MMKIAIALTLFTTASAFSTFHGSRVAQRQSVSSSAPKMAFETELGVQEPIGFFDPLGLLKNADQQRFDHLRYVEIKHGRVAMLAFLGNIITRAGLHLPGSIDKAGDSFASYPNGLAALFGPNSIPDKGLLQIVLFCGFLEIFVMQDVTKNNAFVGDFRNGSLDFGWDTFDDETKLFKRGVELNNGRAAMFGILGLMIHEQLGGSIPIVGSMDPADQIIWHAVGGIQ